MGRTDTGMDTGTARAGRWGRNKDGNSERRGTREQEGQRGTRLKRSPLVVDVSEYWKFYEVDGAD